MVSIFFICLRRRRRRRIRFLLPLVSFENTHSLAHTLTHIHHTLAHKHITHKFIVGRIISWRGSKQKALTKIEKSWLISFLHYIGNEGHTKRQIWKEHKSGGVEEHMLALNVRETERKWEWKAVMWDEIRPLNSHHIYNSYMAYEFLCPALLLPLLLLPMYVCAFMDVLVFSCHICKKNWIWKRTKNDDNNNKQTNKFKTTETCWFLKNDERICLVFFFCCSLIIFHCKYINECHILVLEIHRTKKK